MSAILLGFFLALSLSLGSESAHSPAFQHLGYESRGAIIDVGEITDLWTGRIGIDNAIIALVQEQTYTEALQKGITVSEQNVDEYITEYLNLHNLTNQSWQALLNESGLTINDARHRIRKLLIANEYVRELVQPGINISIEEIEEFYRQNKQKFKPSDPNLQREAPEFSEVQDFINRTIFEKKEKIAGQELINDLIISVARNAVSPFLEQEDLNRNQSSNGSEATTPNISPSRNQPITRKRLHNNNSTTMQDNTGTNMHDGAITNKSNS